MSFYIKDSVSIGPFRFNLSKSGVGLSVGVTGLRFGLGPRGRYIHAGRSGIYYRKTFSSEPGGLLFQPSTQSDSQAPPTPSSTRLEQIDSGAVAAMRDSSSDDLLNEINELHNFRDSWPTVAIVLGLIVVALLFFDFPLWFTAIAALGAAIATKVARDRDVTKRSVALLYDLEPIVKDAYTKVHGVFDDLRKAERVWHIEAQGGVEDARYQAGATHIVQRQRITPKLGLPPFIKSNLDAPVMAVGRQELYFFPDLILVLDGGMFGAIRYQDLKIEIRTSRFIEEEGVPSDAEVVGHSWKYVNKKGTPDKRFKDNRELPVLLYEEIKLSSSTGLNELLQVSRKGIGAQLEKALVDLGNCARGRKDVV